jgi:WD40-like Beta Propeller Repeat
MLRIVPALWLLSFACSQDGRQPGQGTTSNGGGDLAASVDDGGNNADLSTPAVGALVVTPATVNLSIVNGGPPATQTFTVAIHGQTGDTDVTSFAGFSLDDPTIGSMNGATFTTSGAHGGKAVLTAVVNSQMATATITVNVAGGFNAPDCSSCAPFPVGNNLPDVRILTKCATQPTDSRGNPSGGCVLDLNQAMWDFIAKSNRGDSVLLSVRATTDGSCVTTSPGNANINFAEQDVSGAIYYWKSTVSANGTGGQVWRKSFGDATAEEQITNTTNAMGTCFGCHSLSRDGKRMSVNGDDDDSDDEYSDINSGLIDISTKAFITMGGTRAGMGLTQPPGFQTFSPDHTLYLGTDGTGSSTTTNAFFIYNGDTGAAASPATVTAAMMGQRVTMPDWSPDDMNVVYVIPGSIISWSSSGSHFGPHNDDDHISGGSLWVLPHVSGTQFGTPTALIQSMGENNYYPSYSPDGDFVIFNRAMQQPSPSPAAANDSFANPNARVWILPTGAANMGPIDCAALNSTGPLSNSWPRWSPFIQTYHGDKLLWVTFSSTRDYGVLVHNGTAGLTQCYPPDTPENSGAHGAKFPATCKQPQIWMAAINLSTAELHPADPSFPAFWLPFQDMTTHNHTAQWTTTLANTPPPLDGGMCIANGADCTKAPDSCCTGICTGAGTCGIP